MEADVTPDEVSENVWPVSVILYYVPTCSDLLIQLGQYAKVAYTRIPLKGH